DAYIETRLAVELASSQEDIRQPFQEAIGRHFPAWRGINLAPPPVPEAPSPKVVDPTGDLPIFGMVGIVIIILRNVIAKIIKRIITKTVGKVLLRLIPLIGLILLAWELFTLSQ